MYFGKRLIPVTESYRNKRIDSSKLRLLIHYSNQVPEHQFDFGEHSNEEKRKVDYFSWDRMNKEGRMFVILSHTSKGKEIVHGFIEFELSPHEQNVVWFSNISVRPMSRRSGVSTRLINDMIHPLREWMQKENRNVIEISSYTELGNKFVKPILEETLIENEINFVPSCHGQFH